MAIACLRLLCSPCLKWRISVSTSFCVFGPYLRAREDDLRDEELVRLRADDVRRLRDDEDRVRPERGDDALRRVDLRADVRRDDLRATVLRAAVLRERDFRGDDLRARVLR